MLIFFFSCNIEPIYKQPSTKRLEKSKMIVVNLTPRSEEQQQQQQQSQHHEMAVNTTAHPIVRSPIKKQQQHQQHQQQQQQLKSALKETRCYEEENDAELVEMGDLRRQTTREVKSTKFTMT